MTPIIKRLHEGTAVSEQPLGCSKVLLSLNNNMRELHFKHSSSKHPKYFDCIEINLYIFTTWSIVARCLFVECGSRELYWH